MRARRAQSVLTAVALVTLGAAALGAQATVMSECRGQNASGKAPNDFAPPWTVRHPDSVYEQMVGRMSRDEWFFLADSLYHDFEADVSVPLPDQARAVLLAQLDTLRRQFQAVTSRADFTAARSRGKGPDQTRFTEDVDGAVLLLFVNSNRPIRIDSSWTEAQRRAVCGRTIAIRRMLVAWGQPGREEAVKGLQTAANRWGNYVGRGYFQYPWELAINSAGFDPMSDDPPRTQWVIAHPAVGLEFISARTKRLDALQPLETLTLEFGWLRYTESRGWYTGITVFGAVPSDEVAGVGAMLHFGTQFKAGYVLRRRAGDGTSRRGVIVTTDLVQMLARTPTTLQSLRDLALRRVATKKAALLKAVRLASP